MKSLAEFVCQTRELLGYTKEELSERSSLPLNIIEDIESSQELFLATTIRQKLAKGLKLNPSQIKKYEKHEAFTFEVSLETEINLKNSILEGEKNLNCPKCGAYLQTRIARLYDLEDNLVLHPKARCTKCPYQLHE